MSTVKNMDLGLWDEIKCSAVVPVSIKNITVDAVGRAAFHTLSLYEHGEIELPDVAFMPCPDEALRKVWDGVHLLFRVRFSRYMNCPVPLSRRFLFDWCGVSEREARTGVENLVAAGAVRAVAVMRHKGWWMPLYLPQGVSLPSDWEWNTAILLPENVPPRVRQQNNMERMPKVLHDAALRCVSDMDKASASARERIAARAISRYGLDWGAYGNLKLARVSTSSTLRKHLIRYLDAVNDIFM
jgi:hypothetical protein